MRFLDLELCAFFAALFVKRLMVAATVRTMGTAQVLPGHVRADVDGLRQV